MVLHERTALITVADDYFCEDTDKKVIKGDGFKRPLSPQCHLRAPRLVLNDPSCYEMKTDYQDVAETLIKAHKRLLRACLCFASSGKSRPDRRHVIAPRQQWY